MQCPNCNETLIMADRQGVEIDYCPKCRGVWLDRGELDKIVERSAAYTMGPDNTDHPIEQKHYPPPPPSSSQHGGYQQGHGGYQQGHYNDPYNRHKKKKGFLSDFFDFD